MPVALKTALITPLLKKSNLTFISKVIEKVVAVQLVDYINDNNLDESLQSAYKRPIARTPHFWKFIMTYWRLLTTDELLSYYCLTLSAAFDTVDYGILIHRL